MNVAASSPPSPSAAATTEPKASFPEAGRTFDCIVVGGGIVGLATAYRLAVQGVTDVLVLEAENRPAAHQTGHNSGVIHSGLYYKPGSLRAKTCAVGREAMYRFCQDFSIPHERCGKIVVAVEASEMPRLAELQRRGEANGLDGVRVLSGKELREYEPHVAGVGGLFVPQTGIVDYPAVTRKYAELAAAKGVAVRLSVPALSARTDGLEVVVETPHGSVRGKRLIACCGLQSDRFALACGLEPGVRVIPFRGEYYELASERQHLVKNLIYPVPDPRFPFLGVHFTRMTNGGVEAGPNAVLSLDRHGYEPPSASWRDVRDLVTFRGFWRLALKHWWTGIQEMWRSASRDAFVRSLQRLIPELETRDVVPGGCGIRAQAVRPDGTLVDDFHIVSSGRMIHVLNAPSPAATASLAIADQILDIAKEKLSLVLPSPSPLPTT